MKLKKVVALLIVAALSVSMFVGCGKKNNGGSADGEQITLRYATWDLGTEEDNNIYRRMIAKYEEDHPNIKIEIAEDIDPADWNGSLTTAAAGGNLPDVAMIAELPSAIANDWILDVTPYIENDADWAKIPDSLRDSVKFGSGNYGIPYAMNISGLYMNVDLFESKNQPLLTYGYDFAAFEAALKNLSAPSEGIVGIKLADMIDWYPAVKDPSYGYYTLKDGHVNITDPLFIEGVKFCRSVYANGYSFNALSPEQKANFGTENDWEAWNAGKVALCADATWAADGYSKLDSKIVFTSLPNQMAIIIPDYIFISKTTAHPQEAYDFAKFMSFGKDGIMAKLDAVEANEGLNWGSLPLIVDDEITERVFANYPMEGVKEVYENLDGHSIVEAFKYTPGYANARWNALTGVAVTDVENANIAQVFNACISGELNIDDYAEQINKLANESIKEVQDIIDATIN